MKFLKKKKKKKKESKTILMAIILSRRIGPCLVVLKIHVLGLFKVEDRHMHLLHKVQGLDDMNHL